MIDYTGFKFRWKNSNYIVLSTDITKKHFIIQCQLETSVNPIFISWDKFSKEVKDVW